jgi:hypothetical protein
MSNVEKFPQPLPGDVVHAAHRMRAWESDHERGTEGIWIEHGQTALVLQLWRVGHQRVRVRMLFNDRIAMFSCKALDLPRNWHVANRQLPTSGSQ